MNSTSVMILYIVNKWSHIKHLNRSEL